MRLKGGSPESRWRLVFVGLETTSGIRTWEVGREKIVRFGREGLGRSDEKKPSR